MFERGVSEGFIVAFVAFKAGRELVQISHLQHGDDTILFLAADFEKFKKVLTILQIFELISGWRLNFLNVA